MTTLFFTNPVFKSIQYQYDDMIEGIMINVHDMIGTHEQKLEVARKFAKEYLYHEAKKTLYIQLNSKWWRDEINNG